MQSGKPLRIFSTFVSINGEVCQAHQGSICTFIRFAGCNLRCHWCDTKYAQEKDAGLPCSLREIMLRVEQHGCKNVTITGGEPFMQEEALVGLCVELMREGHNISVETNGSFNFPPLGGVDYVVDFKLPSSGEYMHMKVNTPWIHLRPNDWIKFVIKDNLDYEVARAAIASLKEKGCRAQFAMSPILTNVSSNNLLSWLKADCISNVVVSVQLHKLLKLYESQ